ncbi:MAG: hypothetical protein DMD81_03775 [Candidatus Rokuibacteriota bacterium]|nr:MAG: hypothetical protein DMD81_03775 [Candidatus Rokubacteria bacterium]
MIGFLPSLRVVSAVGLALGAMLCAAAPDVAAQSGLKAVGDERPVGKNRTGEECRLRLVDHRPERFYQRFALFCDGWTQSSGDVHRFRVARDARVDRMLTDSSFQKSFETRVAECGAVEPTTLASGAAAVLRECKRLNGGWRVLVLSAVIDGTRGYNLETFPTNLPLLELAVEILEGRRKIEQLGTPPLSAAIRRAETMAGASGKLVGIQDVGAAAALHRLGTLQNWSAHHAESEATFRRLLELQERLVGRDSVPAGVSLGWVALNVADQDRYAEAEQLFLRAEPILKASFNIDDYPRVLTFRSILERRRGNLDQALRFAEEAVRHREVRGPESSGLAFPISAVAMVQWRLKRLDEAERTTNRALALLDKPGGDVEFRLWWAGELQNLLGLIHEDQKLYAEARKAFEKGLARRRMLLGDSVRAWDSLQELGRLSRIEGDRAHALDAYRQAADIQRKDRPTRDRGRPDGTVGYLETLLEEAAASPGARDALMAEAFLAAQLPRGSETARAINNMAARLDAADPAVRAAAREVQEATRQRERVRQQLAVEAMKEPDKREPAREERLKSDLREAEEKVATLEERLQAELPRYAQLTSSRPVRAADLASLLRADEAVIAFLPTRRATYVFVVRHGGSVLVHRASLDAAELNRLVRAVRATLEPADNQLKAFDVASAHRLYALLLGPAADQLLGVQHVIAVPAGPLLSLPLGLLITRPTPPETELTAIPWLARETAISVVPAVASIRELRQAAGRSGAPQPFIGFGDPAFAGAPGDTRSARALAALCRQGDPLDTDLVRGLPRLRETARELTSIATSLQAEAGSVILGADASETRVRATDLSRYRVVAFATHGLLPGELRCKSEPALALTPPDTANGNDDGLLDASEIAQLRLDADWVLLSECNTAGSDGKLGGESLSGLARAFFYAGARALLVSHWAVASRATVLLTTATFDAQAKDATLGRAEALRRAQLTLASDKDTAHPFYWAPFALIGDGGGASARP